MPYTILLMNDKNNFTHLNPYQTKKRQLAPFLRCLYNFISTALLIFGFNHSVLAQSLPFERTEKRSPCDNYAETKQPFFGDLHVHTSYSFDSYVSSQRNDPWDAYRYAKGESIKLPNIAGEQKVLAQIQRPLDFVAVTDHAEFLGPINICTQDSSKLGYWFPWCVLTRSNYFYPQLIAANYWAKLGVANENTAKPKSFACTLSNCATAEAETWSKIQQAAEDHYDRSADCNFTTFVGYEYTDAPNLKNMHRNVIFRNEHVVDKVVSTYDTGSYNFPALWTRLREQCLEGEKGKAGCDVISIPHNPNLAGGMMFRDPKTRQEAEDRVAFEPVVELIQHKASSECRYDRYAGVGVATEDELCDFEQVKADNLGMLGSVNGEIQTERGQSVEVANFHPRNMVRNVLKAGIKMQKEEGFNPFQMGFIGSTDTHSAAPGNTEEDNYVGHLGKRDTGYRNIQDHFYSNPGGHAVVWAEENSRDAIFAGLRNKETYATSGTRPALRFFGGWGYTKALCQSPNMLKQAYIGGVPMGGDLPPRAGEAPSFLVSAMKDVGIANKPGTDLQRIQIIKGWVDANGETHEKVFDIAGTAEQNPVNPENCATAQGFTELCTAWQDPEFVPEQHAFYYARVLENPSCRWSTLQCKAAGVDPFAENCVQLAEIKTQQAQDKLGATGDVYGKCCIKAEDEPFYSPTIQERAWTSPIWYNASLKPH